MASLKSQILGHQEQLSQLEATYQHQRLPHALIFSGPMGIGKKRVALSLAQFLVCESDLKPCGDCGSCVRISKLQSEKLKMVSSDGPAIKVDQIREVLDFLSLSHMGENRIVIIDDAHTLNPQAANALLKSLEEPSENVYFILIAPELSQLMPTIRSRAQAVRFYPLSVQDLKRIRPGLQDWMYSACRGRVDQLVSLSAEEGVSQRQQSFQLLENFLFDVDFLKNDLWKKQFKDRELATNVIRFWMSFLRDLLAMKNANTDLIINKDQTDLMNKSSALSSRTTESLILNLFQAEKDIKGNADTNLVFESLWVKYGQANQ